MVRITPPLMSVCFASGRYSQIVRLVNNIFLDIQRKYELNEKGVYKNNNFLMNIIFRN